MKRNVFFLLLGFSCNMSFAGSHLMLKYSSPAKIWEATLPLGNGRIGMMPDGGIFSEDIILNDISMWSGSEQDAVNNESINYLPKIRELLLQEKNIEAQKIMYEHFRCKGKGSALGNAKDEAYGCFQMLGNLRIAHKNKSDTFPTLGYSRLLDISEAVAYTGFTQGKVKFEREYFVSHEDDIMVIRMKSSQHKALSFTLHLSRPERSKTTVENNVLYMEGQLNDGYDTNKGLRYFTKVKVLNKGGKIFGRGDSLSVSDAKETIILISTSTNMLNKNYKEVVDSLLNRAEKKSYYELKRAHIRNYKEKFNRVELQLGNTRSVQKDTDQRLENFQKDEDPNLVSLYFQFGRYLMISGTRENSLPLNLQGLWANSIETPWNGDYHLNINVQMNYWPAEVCNLSELHKPLIDFTKSLQSSGAKTAQGFYGAQGWVAHVISNPWCFTAPGEHASWGATNTGGAWLCEHLWEHYDFTQDKDYLRSVYPVLKGAADFFLTNMISDSHGYLLTAPSSSPENAFYLPGSNEAVYVCMGPTMDIQIIRELFANLLKASEILDIHDESIAEVKKAMQKLPPMKISSAGYLQEWLQDYKEVDVQHRHVSHLYGLYPSNQISSDKTPELSLAAKKTLERRGDGGTGWSRAWKICFWARLKDGNRAHSLLKNLLVPVNSGSHSGGSYPNLFCAHPPFQIDGNLGGTAGIAEMLIQSQNGYIELLPAIPDTWENGFFKGLCVRGGAEVSVTWENNRIKQTGIIAKAANCFKLKLPSQTNSVLHNGKELPVREGIVELCLKKGESINLVFK